MKNSPNIEATTSVVFALRGGIKNGLTLRQQDSVTLRGEVFVLFIYIQSEPMNVSVGVG